MAISKVIYNNRVLMDATSATATAEDIVTSKTAMLNNGVMTTGLGNTGVVITEEQDEHGGTIVNVDTGRKLVKFIDYDGTVVATRTKAEIDAMTSDSDLPANPTHTGLTAQGWNWTVAQLKSQLAAMPNQDVIVGQMYVTTSGDTEIDVEFVDSARLSPYLRCAVNGTITIDWGDETTPDTVTGTSLTEAKNMQHTYATTGSFTIAINVTSGSFVFYGTSSYSLLHRNNDSNTANNVYSNCVKRIRIGNNADIKSYAFSNCMSLTAITIPSTVTQIPSNAFRYCYSLISVTIPFGITVINSSAFSGCKVLSSISIPYGMITIGSSAFNGCFSCPFITIPSTVTSIGASAFYYCYSLQSITIPYGITALSNSLLYGCYGLSTVVLPSSITTIGFDVFYECRSIASISIPTSVTSIGNSAFYGCFKLKTITIPQNVTSIGNSSFSHMDSVESINILATNISIGNNAFSSCASLKSFKFPSGTTSTYYCMFNYCYSLQSVSLPSNITSIADAMFEYCYPLKSIEIPSTVTDIVQYSFEGCGSLASVTIPSGVTHIGQRAFTSCQGMKEYHFLPETPPTLDNTNAFLSIPTDCIMYVPYSSDHSILTAYQTATNWSTYASYMQEEEV